MKRFIYEYSKKPFLYKGIENVSYKPGWDSIELDIATDDLENALEEELNNKYEDN